MVIETGCSTWWNHINLDSFSAKLHDFSNSTAGPLDTEHRQYADCFAQLQAGPWDARLQPLVTEAGQQNCNEGGPTELVAQVSIISIDIYIYIFIFI